ncbi:MAG TPA: PAS domain S-box protein, partial [Candidatus Nanopelagicales bacterium]|nr:PAS domain S-box protein [Candidatus Nanopelagicales bacterium]
MASRFGRSMPRELVGASGHQFRRSSRLVRALEQSRASERELSRSQANLRKLAEELERRVEERTCELRESEARLRLALESAQAGTFEVDLGTGLVRTSPSTDRLFGFDPVDDEHTIAEYSGRIHPEDIARVEEAIARSAEQGTPHSIDYRLVLGDGQERWLASRAEPLFGDDGRPVRLIGALMDITDRKRAEDALRAATEAKERNAAQLEAVIANLGEGLAITAPDGTMMTMSQAGLRMHDLTSVDEVPLAPDLFDAFTVDGLPVGPGDWPMARAIRGEHFSGVELRVWNRHTRREWYGRYSGGPVHDQAGQPIAAVVIFQDVTQQKRSENELALLLESERAARS